MVPFVIFPPRPLPVTVHLFPKRRPSPKKDLLVAKNNQSTTVPASAHAVDGVLALVALAYKTGELNREQVLELLSKPLVRESKQ